MRTRNLNKLAFVLFLLLIGYTSAMAQACGCTFTIPPLSPGTYTFDGAVKGAKPGDVICIAAGAHERIIFQNLTGHADNYITIKNCGGQVLLGSATANQAMQFGRSKYFHLTGTGDAGFEYGLKVVQSAAGTQGIHVFDLSTDVEIDHVEITKTGFAGIMTKSDPSKDCNNYVYERTNPTMTDIFVMRNLEIHHNYVHDIGGEGIYCGNSFFTGATAYCPTRVQYPHEIRGVNIYDNIFDNCAWESIQVGSAVQAVDIHDNKLYNYGAANVYAQNGGIQVGVGTSATVRNNFIKKGFGIAIFVQGIGNNFVYNNTIVNAGTYAILMSLTATPLMTDIAPKGFVGPVRIMNNTIVTPQALTGDTPVKESVVGPVGNIMYNNLVVGGPSTWLKLRGDTDWKQTNNVYIPTVAAAGFVNAAADDYHLASGSPAINVGKDISAFLTDDADGRARPAGGSFDLGAFEFNGNEIPVVTVEASKTISLPTVTTTLTGSATDADGTVSSLVWTKTSGPAATLINAGLPTLNVAGLVAGVYVFRLTATDNGSQQGYKEVTVTVADPATNQPPVANGGGNRTVVLPTTNTSLTGSASDADGIVSSYVWTKISALTATMANATTPTLTLTALQQGTHTFRLTVKDDKGASDFKDVQVFVQPAGTNQIPIANAGTDKAISLPTTTVTLTGLGSDPDGSISSYSWSKVSGPAATIATPGSASTAINGLVEGTYVFRLTVKDNSTGTGTDDVTVTVTSTNKAPKSNAGSDKTIQLPTSATTLPGSGSDDDGSISGYSWLKISGPNNPTLSNAGTNTLSVSGLIAGTYVFQLTVTDNAAATGSDEVTLIVQAANVAPVANPGGTKNLILPINSATLVGSGTDADGSIAGYLWEKVSGPAATLGVTDAASLALSNLIEGTYVFKLTVTDNNGAMGSNTVSVIVFPPTTNLAPIVEAGTNVTLTLPANSTTLTGVASDPDGSISGYLWEKISGPTATLGGATSATLSLTNLVAGTYLFRFTATDNLMFSSSDEVTVAVSAVNQAPIVDVGPPVITVVLPTSTVSITATASDPDGTIASYSWALNSAPNTPAVLGATTDHITVNGLIAGNYVFRCTVTDNQSATGYDDVTVNVQTAANAAPVAHAGDDALLFLPTSTINLTGSGTDSDGTIASYGWTQVSAPAGTLTNAGTQTLTVTGMTVPGAYTYRLTVTDDDGATAIDDITVTVSTSNQAPVADAGPNISLSLPVNSTNLIGSGSDADGNIATYSWLKVSGPPVSMSNQGTAVLSIQDLTTGIYVFRLTVTDNDAAFASATTTVTVLPATVNQTPVVTAGNSITLTLPNSSLNLVAIASDADGSIATYQWSKLLGPTVTMSGQATNTLSLSDLVEGAYNFRITVTDDDGAQASADVKITVQATGSNQPPSANAGSDRTLFLPNNSVTLSGTGTDDDGSINTYSWDKTSGPPATLTNQTSPSLSVAGMTAGEYTFRLTVTDNDGLTSSDEVKVTVFPGTVNQSPVANAGSNKTIVLPTNDATLAGSGFDPDGSIASYAWIQKTGPSATIQGTDSPTLQISDLIEGVFQFELTVTDDEGAIGSDVATITVIAAGAQQPPIADAGFDKVVKLPTTTLDIAGSGTDPDGSIATYLWAKKTGASAVALSGTGTSTLHLTNLEAGAYTFTLTVTDNDGLMNSDDMRVSVVAAGVNSNPVVDAGPNVVVRQPATTATINATASDPDGSISTYSWSKVSGGSAVLGATGTSSLQLSGLSLGSYVFRIEVVDNSGASSSDEVMLTVSPPGTNSPPTVLAGGEKTVGLPAPDVVLVGSVSDSDGSITSVKWTQTAGPNTAALTGDQSATLTLNNLVLGLYSFRLTATDNENASAFSETTVQVTDGLSLPQVFAGNDTTLYLPNNALELIGLAEDSETNITTYVWNQTEGDPVKITGDYPEVFISELLPGSYKFVLTATDDKGNSGSDDIVVNVTEGKSNPLGAAIVFTPNGDLVNDVWVIRNSNMIVGCPVAIFNSLGKKIYSASEYQNDWNGTFDGQIAREGDYYFVFDCADKTYSGALRIVR